MKNVFKFLSFSVIAGMTLMSCEGPMGPAGADGTNGIDGKDGKDANESCTLCHNSDVVDAKAIEYEHALHFTGEAYDEGTRTNCAPCHSHQGFRYVVKNNVPATFTLNSGTGKYDNNYVVPAATATLPGPISCFTCHSSLHTSYTDDDFLPLTTTAAVPMTMWGGSKSINFSKNSANLCSKCHQPRPVTKSSDSNVIDYALLKSDPTATYNQGSISFRTGVHYGTQSAMAAGVGGIEFGTGYTNSAHVANASCNACHMAAPTGLAGGHSFDVVGNFNGCNVTGCHSTMSATNATYTAAVADISAKLDALAAKINAIGAGHDILQKDPADGKYHGYFDIYDAGSNPTGYWKNPAYGSPAFPALTNAQFGAALNYQLAFRGGGNGVHNYPYIKKLLENSTAAW